MIRVCGKGSYFLLFVGYPEAVIAATLPLGIAALQFKRKILLRPKSGNWGIPVQRKLVELNGSHALPDNRLQFCRS